MEPTFEQKIDRIATDVAYMRGKWDETIPQLKKKSEDHDAAIRDLEQKQANQSGRSGIIGAIGGSAVAAFFGYLFINK